MNHSIFWPVIALVALTFIVWVRMYLVRTAEIRRRRIDPQALATSQSGAGLLQDVAPADNFRNLFEVPVLFYVVCIALAITGGVTGLQLALAWAFVALRAIHSAIHITGNRVMHRFAVYVLGALCVYAMWALLALHLVRIA